MATAKKRPVKKAAKKTPAKKKEAMRPSVSQKRAILEITFNKDRGVINIHNSLANIRIKNYPIEDIEVKLIENKVTSITPLALFLNCTEDY